MSSMKEQVERSQQYQRQQQQQEQEAEYPQQLGQAHGYQQYELHSPSQQGQKADADQGFPSTNNSSTTSVKSLYIQMYTCEVILCVIALVVISFAGIFVSAKPPPTLMAASAINIVASIIQIIRPCAGFSLRPRSKSDPRPRKSTLVYLVVMNVLWALSSILIFAMTEYQLKKEREEKEELYNYTYKDRYFTKRRGGGGRGGGGGGGSGSVPSLSYEAGDLSKEVFYTCGGLAGGLFVISLWQWICVFLLYRNKYSPRNVQLGDQAMKKLTKVQLRNPFTGREYELKRIR